MEKLVSCVIPTLVARVVSLFVVRNVYVKIFSSRNEGLKTHKIIQNKALLTREGDEVENQNKTQILAKLFVYIINCDKYMIKLDLFLY